MLFFSSYAGVNDPSLFASPVGAPPDPSKSFDFVICGGGTAGCVLASRLSEDPNISVLLIEAGESDQKQLMSRIPAGWANLLNTPVEWSFRTVPQAECNDREMYQPRGKMLGGCSSINAMIYQHGSPEDFDEWEQKGAHGWNYDALKPYFRKAESHTPHPDHKIDMEHRGKDGPWISSYPPTNEMTKAFVLAGAEAGIPHNPDLNVELNSTGITRFQAIINNGQRSSTNAAYLPKSVYSRKNLSILTGTQVTRLVFDSPSSGPRRCTSVEVGQTKAGPRWVVGVKKEAIVSQGAFGTPQLLLASGIGAKAELEKVGVPIIKDLPGVGAYLKDHILATVSWKAKKGASLQYFTNPVATIPALARWLIDGKGPLSSNVAEAGAFLRSDDVPGQTSSIAKGTTNAAGTRSPDLELITVPLFLCLSSLEKPDPAWGPDFFTIAPVVLRPFSSGTVKISSGNTFDSPLIDPRYLTDKRDLAVMIEGLKLCRRIARTEPLSAYLGDSVQLDLDNATDEQLVEQIKKYAETVYHPMSTAKIGDEVAGGVVDSNLKVYGFEGLRVCDASIFPEALSAHPVAAVVACAERFADLLKAEYKA